jgi:hypothetical protein
VANTRGRPACSDDNTLVARDNRSRTAGDLAPAKVAPMGRTGVGVDRGHATGSQGLGRKVTITVKVLAQRASRDRRFMNRAEPLRNLLANDLENFAEPVGLWRQDAWC